jgi:hypothetical protein
MNELYCTSSLNYPCPKPSLLLTALSHVFTELLLHWASSSWATSSLRCLFSQLLLLWAAAYLGDFFSDLLLLWATCLSQLLLLWATSSAASATQFLVSRSHYNASMTTSSCNPAVQCVQQPPEYMGQMAYSLPGWLSFACHGLEMAGATLVKAWPLFLWSLWV